MLQIRSMNDTTSPVDLATGREQESDGEAPFALDMGVEPSDAPRVAPARRSTRGRRFPAEVLTPAEVDALLRRCSRRAPTGIRNRALIAVLYRAGLRISEALALLPKDVDLQAGSIRVLHGKGDVDRTVGCDAGAAALLELWLSARVRALARYAPDVRPDVAPLFCTLRGEVIIGQYVRGLFPRLARKAGITKRVHPHGFRHTHAAELAREGTPLNLIQAQLGHTSVATTSRYLAHIAPQELVNAIRARSWTPG